MTNWMWWKRKLFDFFLLFFLIFYYYCYYPIIPVNSNKILFFAYLIFRTKRHFLLLLRSFRRISTSSPGRFTHWQSKNNKNDMTHFIYRSLPFIAVPFLPLFLFILLFFLLFKNALNRIYICSFIEWNENFIFLLF